MCTILFNLNVFFKILLTVALSVLSLNSFSIYQYLSLLINYSALPLIISLDFPAYLQRAETKPTPDLGFASVT